MRSYKQHEWDDAVQETWLEATITDPVTTEGGVLTVNVMSRSGRVRSCWISVESEERQLFVAAARDDVDAVGEQAHAATTRELNFARGPRRQGPARRSTFGLSIADGGSGDFDTAAIRTDLLLQPTVDRSRRITGPSGLRARTMIDRSAGQ